MKFTIVLKLFPSLEKNCEFAAIEVASIAVAST